jgi:predicted outer membrane protein
MQHLEPAIATMLIIDNNKEIAEGQLAKQHAQSDEVKQFADMMIKDHSQLVQQLQEHAGAAARGTPRGQPGLESRRGTNLQRPGASPAQTATASDRQNQDRNEQTAQSRTTSRTQQSDSAQQITVAKPAIGNQPGAEFLALHQEIADACLERARRDAQKAGKDFDKHFMAAQVVGHKQMLDKLQVFEQHVSPELKQVLAQAQQSTQQHLQEAERIHEQLSTQGSRASETPANTQNRTSREQNR